MGTTVSRKPMAVCVVSAVPTKCGSVVSVSEVEKTPESAMTAAPQTNRKATRTTVGAMKNIGDATQHVPLTRSAVTAVAGRPKRSEAHPPRRQPIVPAIPIVTNVINPVDDADAFPRRPRPVRTNIASHVHRA
jgi:hypothetical protein